MAEIELRRVIAVLPAKDVAASVAFYKHKLGFSQLFDMGVYAGIGRGPIELHLDGAAPSTPISVRIDVGGVDALYAEIDRGIVKPDETLETKPWGMRQFSVLDPAGNRITFAEAAGRG